MRYKLHLPGTHQLFGGEQNTDEIDNGGRKSMCELIVYGFVKEKLSLI